MTADKFRELANSIRPGSDLAVEIWMDWASELEEYDSSHWEKPAGSYKTAEVFLDEFAQKFTDIWEQYRGDVAGKVIFLTEIGSCPFPWEMKLAAEHLAASGSVHDIAAMEVSGVLEDFSDIVQEDDGPSMGM